MKDLELRVIYDPKTEGIVPDVDLVLVHGFAGDVIDTWTSKSTEGNIFWPRELLLRKQPGTRVLSFGYDAGELAFSTIRDNARTMLSYLKSLRRDPLCENRPIVFLGHCLGGLIVRQALNFAKSEIRYRPISSATKSIMFFGTPHGGGDKKAWLELAKSYKGFGPKCKMIDVLANNTDDLIEIDEDFCRMAPAYTIVNFIESKPMPGMSKPIVGKTSAVKIGGDEADYQSAPGDHLTMCQFRDIKNNAFDKVCETISEAANIALAEHIPVVIPQTNPGGQALLMDIESGDQQVQELQQMLESVERGGKTKRFIGRFFGKGGSRVDIQAQISSPKKVSERVHQRVR